MRGFASSHELLERAGALESLRAALEAARSAGAGRVVFVGGEAGVGKTSLVRAFAADQGGSTRVLWGACDALFTPRPLGPLVDVAPDAGGALAQALAGDARPHDVAAALLADLEASAPSIVVFEDVHWADEATLDVIRLLGRRIAAGALLVCTYRDDELARAHPLRVVLGELATAGNVERLGLEPLSRAAIAELGEQAGVDAGELHRRTGGNPFFVTEVLATAQDAIPGTVRDAVLARAARLGDDARALLDAVAIVPLAVELWLLEAIAGAPAAALDECVSAGMLTGAGPAVGFRHELARLAIEESLSPTRALALHRAALAALQEPPGGEPDLARLAHHAEAAGDPGAVLRFAPAAGERATSLGAHREAAAQYARALRCAGALTDAVRADLLERRALACYATGLTEDAITAQEEAVLHRRAASDARAEGDALRSLGRLLGFAGQAEAGAAAAREAVAVLERLPPGRELAMAYATLSQRAVNWEDITEAIEWGTKALELAEALGDDETVVYALTNLAGARFRQDNDDGRRGLEHALELARRTGTDDQVARILHGLAHMGLRYRRLDVVGPAVAEGLEFCAERGLDLWRAHFGACEARLELSRGRWDAAAGVAQRVEDDPRGWWIPRLMAQSVRGLVAARRGDAGAAGALDGAWRSAEPSGELSWIGPVAAARAEAAWLDGDAARVAAVTEPALELVERHEAEWAVRELCCWRRRAGLDDTPPPGASSDPYTLELTGDWRAAADWWRAAGCPYEAALALADGDDVDALRQSLEQLQALGANPAAGIVARRLRSRGERRVPRGPRATTRENPAGLTARELDVLARVAEGLRNAQIAERLYLSEKTVDHHVSAILRKLGVRSRGEASRAAARLGLLPEDGDAGAANMGNSPVSAPPTGP